MSQQIIVYPSMISVVNTGPIGPAGPPGANGLNGSALVYQNHGAAGAAETISSTLGDIHRLLLDAANCVLTFSFPAGVSIVEVILEQPAGGNSTVTWPAIRWAGGDIEPTLSPDPFFIDMFQIKTFDGGATRFGDVIGYGY